MPLTSFNGVTVVPLWMAGTPRSVDATTNLQPVHSAIQGEAVHQYVAASPEDAKLAVDAASAAFASWSTISYDIKRAMLLRAADILAARAEDLIASQVAETSCSDFHAQLNVNFGAEIVREVASAITAAHTGSVPPIPAAGALGLTIKQPIGPVLIIPPWNSAVVLAIRGMASALAAGCTIVLKASELCPLTHSLLVECFEAAGVPKGVINQIQTSREYASAVTEAVIGDERIRKIEFIGSAAVGRNIAQIAGKYLKPVLMELGGKSPAIVLEDADLPKAAKTVAAGAFLHHGQICCSTERVIVLKEVAEKFAGLLKDEVLNSYSMSAGNAVSMKVAAHAKEFVDDAVRRGAEYLVGNNSFLDDIEISVEPTVVRNIPAEALIRDEETFGPSLSFYVVDSENQAVELANRSAYGLTASIFTKDTMKALELAKQLDYGTIAVNNMTLYDHATLPIKGVKASGWGSNNGHWGIEEFLVEKTVGLHRADGALPFGL
jgi:acyl-CoA reductase-like NAD-dependent aldehyde dehydrogenase